MEHSSHSLSLSTIPPPSIILLFLLSFFQNLNRFNEEETSYMMARWPKSSYFITIMDLHADHERMVGRMLNSLLSIQRLTLLEHQFTTATATATATTTTTTNLRTLDVLRAVSFNHARYVQGGLFYPFTTPTLDANAADDAFIASVNSAGNDQLRCFAIRNVAVAANKIMHSKTAHASVRAGASGKKC